MRGQNADDRSGSVSQHLSKKEDVVSVLHSALFLNHKISLATDSCSFL
jgi:hypothetical protein